MYKVATPKNAVVYTLTCPRNQTDPTSEKKRVKKMVCLACLLPLFLVPIVNLLPILFDYIMAKVYRLFGWEYRKPERAPPACPYKPSANAKANNSVTSEPNLAASDPPHKPVGVNDDKQD